MILNWIKPFDFHDLYEKYSALQGLKKISEQFVCQLLWHRGGGAEDFLFIY